MASVETAPTVKSVRDKRLETRYLLLDTESVPDGRLIARTRYKSENLEPEEAIRRAQAEARDRSASGSDFLPVTYQYPVAVCVIRLDANFELLAITCLGAPEFRPAEIVKQFWDGVRNYAQASLVTFNGRGFDMPLLELAAFRYRCCGTDYFKKSRKRFDSNHFDLHDWLSNYGACRLAGGLDLLSKLLGKPGKMEVCGDQVYEMYCAGKVQEINDYCMCDTLDTYFVFLRTQVMMGGLAEEAEHKLVLKAKVWLAEKSAESPALGRYLENWGDWEPWP